MCRKNLKRSSKNVQILNLINIQKHIIHFIIFRPNFVTEYCKCESMNTFFWIVSNFPPLELLVTTIATTNFLHSKLNGYFQLIIYRKKTNCKYRKKICIRRLKIVFVCTPKDAIAIPRHPLKEGKPIPLRGFAPLSCIMRLSSPFPCISYI